MDTDPYLGSNNPPSEIIGLDIDLEEILRCPICFEVCKPPIYQCVNYHTICSICKPKLKKKCPTCKSSLPVSLRNRTLETLYDNTNFSCPNKSLGCNKAVKGMEFESHARGCVFRRVSCIFDKTWNTSGMVYCDGTMVLQFQHFSKHLQDYHGVLVKEGGEYCCHDLFLFIGEVPLAIWKYQNLKILQTLTLKDHVICISCILLEDPDSIRDKCRIEIQVIRKGLNCAPNIRHGLFTVGISAFSDNEDKRIEHSVVFQEDYFKSDIARCNPRTCSYCWITRVDLKVPSS